MSHASHEKESPVPAGLLRHNLLHVAGLEISFHPKGGNPKLTWPQLVSEGSG